MDLALYGIAYHGALLISEAIGLTLDSVRGGPAVIRLEVIGRRGEESQLTLEGDAAAWMSAWLAIRPVPAARCAQAVRVHSSAHPAAHVATARMGSAQASLQSCGPR